MESVNSVVNSQKEPLSEQSLETEKQNLERDKEEKVIKDIYEKITRGIPATVAISLGEKLVVQGELFWGRINPDNSNFYNWVKKLTGLKEDSVNDYIELYQEFKDVQNLIRDWMNKSHLMNIKKYSDRYELRKEIIIDILINLDENEEIKAFRKTFRDTEDLHIAATLFDEMLSYSPNIGHLTSHEAVINIVFDFKRFSDSYKKFLDKYKEKTSLSFPSKHGPPLEILDNCELNRKLKRLISYEPTDEQSFVGLFCLMFYLLKEEKVKVLTKTGNFLFARIDFIRVKFPDARIQLTNLKDGKDYDFYVEFEFESSRYITHNHHKERKECHMIICWKDDLKNEDFRNFGLPQVFSIERLLKEGQSSVRSYEKL